MNHKMDLVGKTISRVVAAQDSGAGPAKIFMLQFTDGTHVEFVSPVARKRLRSISGGGAKGRNRPAGEVQLALNVA